jgi:hypothetical protein
MKVALNLTFSQFFTQHGAPHSAQKFLETARSRGLWQAAQVSSGVRKSNPQKRHLRASSLTVSAQSGQGFVAKLATAIVGSLLPGCLQRRAPSSMAARLGLQR